MKQCIVNSTNNVVRGWNPLGYSTPPMLYANETIQNYITDPSDTTKELLYQNGDIVVTANPAITFNSDLIMSGALPIFQNQLLQFSSVVGLLRELMAFQNWSVISSLRDQMLQAGQITQDQANQFTALFAQQGIVLP